MWPGGQARQRADFVMHGDRKSLCIRHVAAMLAITFLLALPGNDSAYADGNELLRQCGSAVAFMDDPSKYVGKAEEPMFCLGYMQGLTHMSRAYERATRPGFICLPDTGLSNEQAARVVVKYLRDHPELLHLHELLIVIPALKAAFPCGARR